MNPRRRRDDLTARLGRRPWWTAVAVLLLLAGPAVPAGAQVNAPDPDTLPSAVWADRVVAHTPGDGFSSGAREVQDARRVLAVPDCAEGATEHTCGLDQADGPRGFLSLGDGGLVEVAFVDNVLVGDGDQATPDLFVYEVGPAAEATRVTIVAADGTEVQLFDPSGSDACGNDPDATGDQATTLVGDISGVDIDCWLAFNDLPADSRFTGVVVQDVPAVNPPGNSPTQGADIDGIGSSAEASRPAEPSERPSGAVTRPPAATIRDVLDLPSAVRLAGDYTTPGGARYRVLRLDRHRYRAVVVVPPNECYRPGDTIYQIRGWDSSSGAGTGSIHALLPPSCAQQPVDDARFRLTVSDIGQQQLTGCVGEDNCVTIGRLAPRLLLVDGEDADTSSALAGQLLVDILINSTFRQMSSRQLEERLVYVVTNRAFADALSVSGVTGATRGVMLQVDPDDPAANDAALAELDPDRIVVVGGTAAVPDDAFTVPADRERIGGTNRFDTAARISRSTYDTGVDAVYVATGANFPDALSGGAQASTVQAPILLVDGGRMPEETEAELARLDPAEIRVLGGTAVVPESMVDQLRDFSPVVTRVSGASRVDTAIEVSKAGYPDGAPVTYLASGEAFNNALTASANAWVLGGPLLLVGSESLPAATAEEVMRLDPDHVVLLSDAFELDSDVRTDVVNLVDALG